MTTIGTENDDVLDGTSADDVINGLGGNDTLRGNDGNDILDGGDGDDKLYGFNDSDTLIGGAGNDTLFAHAGDDWLSGGAGNDRLSGGAGNDVYHFDLGWGDDHVSFQQGTGNGSDSDAIEFGAGIFADDFSASRVGYSLLLTHSNGDTVQIDSFFFPASGFKSGEARFADGTVWTAEDMQSLSNVGTENDDVLEGTSADDVINGLGGNDTLRGNDGNDTLDGGDDDDSVYGLNGDDTLTGGRGRDMVFGHDGDDWLNGGPGNDHLDGGSGSDVIHFDLGWGNDHLGFSHGQSDNNEKDIIQFGAGIMAEDITASFLGSSLVVTHVNGDTITINTFGISRFIKKGEVHFADGTIIAARDVIITTIGTENDDTLLGAQGNDWRDHIIGNAGDDNLRGLSGDDHLDGGDGNDYLSGDGGDDLLRGQGGDDFLAGGLGNDVLDGGHGIDRLFGASGNDSLWGHFGDDELNGGSGQDHLIGEAGNDRLIGGEHEDLYWFGPDWGHDTIDNYDTAYFLSGQGWVRPWDGIVFEDGISSTDIDGHRDGNDLVLSHTSGSTIRVENQYLSFDHEVSFVEFQDGAFWGFDILDYVGPEDPGANTIDAVGIGLQVSGSDEYQIVNGIASVSISLRGRKVGPDSLAGWEALEAGANDTGGYSVLWHHEDGRHSVWDVTAAGAWTSSEVVSGQNVAELVGYEDRFVFDFNGDGEIGLRVNEIDTVGIGLQSSTQNLYQIVDEDVLIDLSLRGRKVGPDSLAGWEALEAGANDTGGYSVLWHHEDGRHSVWDVTAAGAWTSSEVVSGQNVAELVGYEDRFVFDFNGDGEIGLRVNEIDTVGIGLQSSTQNLYQIVDEDVLIDLSLRGRKVGPDSLAGWEALEAGANDTGGYSVLWHHEDGRHSVWDVTAAGAWTSSEVVSGQNVAELVGYEDRFVFDFNGDGEIGLRVNEIDTVGIGLQSSTQNLYQIVDEDVLIDLSLRGRKVGPDSLAGWEALEAGANDTGGYSVLWHHEDGRHSVWDVTAAGAWTSSEVVSGQNVAELVGYEDRFVFDFNGDGEIGLRVNEIDTVGIGLQSSTQNLYQIVDEDVLIDLSLRGRKVGPDSLAGWEALEAGANDTGGYSVLWHHEDGRHSVWDVTAAGAWTSSEVVSGQNVAELVGYEDRFVFDFNGDGEIWI